MISTHLAVQPRTGEKIEYCISRIEMDEQISAREWFFRQAPCASIDEFFGYRRLGNLSYHTFLATGKSHPDYQGTPLF
jgi:hypothetical protein